MSLNGRECELSRVRRAVRNKTHHREFCSPDGAIDNDGANEGAGDFDGAMLVVGDMVGRYVQEPSVVDSEYPNSPPVRTVSPSTMMS